MGGWARKFSSWLQPGVVPLLMGKIQSIVDAQTAWLSYAVFAWDKLGIKKRGVVRRHVSGYTIGMIVL